MTTERSNGGVPSASLLIETLLPGAQPTVLADHGAPRAWAPLPRVGGTRGTADRVRAIVAAVYDTARPVNAVVGPRDKHRFRVAATPVTGPSGMLLYLSSGGDRVRCGEGTEQLPGDVALERSHDLLRGAAFGSSARDVGAGGRIDAHADDSDRRERSVQASVTAAVESMPHGVARRGWD